MESNTKMRKGFMKGKLVMSFIRAAKPSTTMQPYNTNTKTAKTSHNVSSHIKPTITNQKTTPSPSSLIMNQEKVNTQPKHMHRVSYVVPKTTNTYGMFDNPYGVVVDDAVDAKATTYISCVQERFKLEHVNNDLVEPAS